MVWPVVAAVGASVIGGIISSQIQKSAANKAASAQERSAAQGVAFQREQLAEQQHQYNEQMAEYQRKQGLLEKQQAEQRTMLAPYQQAGQGALFEMLALTGMQAPTQVASPVQESAYKTPGLLETARQRAYTDIPKSWQEPSLSIQDGNTIDLKNIAGTWKLPSTLPGATGGDMGDLEKNLERYYALKRSGSLYSDMVSSDVRNKALKAYDYAKKLDAQQATQQQQAYQTDKARMEALQVESPYAGMTGQQAQEAAISKISESPLLQELTKQGEQAILQQSAATGGLRGGNIQGALAQYRPQMLQAEIDKQYSRMAQLSGLGQQSILGSPTTAAQAYPTGTGVDTSIAQLYSQLGQSNAANALAQGQATGQMWSNIGQAVGYGFGNYLNQPQTNTSNTQYFDTGTGAGSQYFANEGLMFGNQ